MGAIDRFFTGHDDLPALPDTARRLLAPDEAHGDGWSELLEHIAGDPALAASMQRLAGAAPYGAYGCEADLGQAVALLGPETVRNLALSAWLMRLFPRTPALDGERFWRHCVATGGYARWLGRTIGWKSTSAYGCGFLLRAGQLLMAAELPHMVAAVEAECIRPGLRMSVERQKIGCCHAQITSELAHRWQLPAALVEAFMHAPDPAHARPPCARAAVLQLASAAADAGDLHTPSTEWPTDYDSQVLSQLRLDAQWLRERLPSYESVTYSARALAAAALAYS